MGSTIHMETEQVRAVAHKLDQVTSDIQQQVASIGNKLRGLNWQSPSRDEFIRDYDNLERKIMECTEQGTTLGIRMQHEVDEWEQAAMSLAAGSLTTEQRHTQAISDARQSIEEHWKEMSIEERKKWLEDWYKDLCKRLGITPVDFKVSDLKDPVGKDARGVFNPGILVGLFSSLTIDIDNVKGDDPFEILETVAHETRHQYQHYLVEHPDKRPPDISEETIKSWKENFDNYKKADKDFEAYRKQPIEQDARQSGQAIVDQYVDSSAEVI